MKVLVAVKRVLDSNARVRVLPDGSGVDLTNAKMAMNPFCEIALEEALRMKEKKQASEVLAVSLGPPAALDTLRTALAMGADRALLVRSPQELQPLGVAKLLAAVVKKEAPRLVLLGKLAIDDDSNQTGQMLAGLLAWPQATFASKIALDEALNHAEVTREVDEGSEVVRVALPAVITADLRLNQPRYATLPGIMKAKKKTIEEIEASSLGVDFAPRFTVTKIEEPPKRKAGVMVASVEELVEKLRKEAKVIP